MHNVIWQALGHIKVVNFHEIASTIHAICDGVPSPSIVCFNVLTILSMTVCISCHKVVSMKLHYGTKFRHVKGKGA